MGCITSYKAALYAYEKGELKLNLGRSTAKWARENGFMGKTSFIEKLKGNGHWTDQFLKTALSSKEKFVLAYNKSGADFMVFDTQTNQEIMDLGLTSSIGEN